MKTIAIIPARGGSKRIPGKNIKPFGGKPMIAWSIEAALESKVFSRVIVSTDDPTIAEIARERGAEVPFFRPAELSGDQAAFMPVIRHVLHEIPGNTHAFAVYATAPFLRPERLREAAGQLEVDPSAEFVLAVTPFDYPVQRALIRDAQSALRFREPEFALKRSQELDPCYRDAGQFFGGRIDALMAHDAVLFARCLPVVIPRDEAVDIDTSEDWEFAERLLRLRRSKE
jgi:N-acylneuraminate cytidylyltransferase